MCLSLKSTNKAGELTCLACSLSCLELATMRQVIKISLAYHHCYNLPVAPTLQT